MNDLKEKEREKNQKRGKEKTTTSTRACASEENWVHHNEIAALPGFNSLYFKKHFTVGAFNLCADKLGLTKKQRIEWLQYIDSVGWCYPTGRKITILNFQRSLRMWRVVDDRIKTETGSGRASTLSNAKQNEYEVIKKREQVKRVKQAMKSENWELCAERCAMFREGKCVCGAKIPPQLRERPIAPEECEQYQGKEVQ